MERSGQGGGGASLKNRQQAGVDAAVRHAREAATSNTCMQPRSYDPKPYAPASLPWARRTQSAHYHSPIPSQDDSDG